MSESCCVGEEMEGSRRALEEEEEGDEIEFDVIRVRMVDGEDDPDTMIGMNYAQNEIRRGDIIASGGQTYRANAFSVGGYMTPRKVMSTNIRGGSNLFNHGIAGVTNPGLKCPTHRTSSGLVIKKQQQSGGGDNSHEHSPGESTAEPQDYRLGRISEEVQSNVMSWYPEKGRFSGPKLSCDASKPSYR
eukprot:CAMPEP_0173414674 /NCGR_PEP_ID=MMETSP1356-20130122/84455_1 /TAXON_ID=77927 ORGANISM="Hemiselmis virescens, Strain PCC157" /NCGR_SAMPLE_ID=MMETSP1356 /ASSEMBLY_ACC=CAM_ASM_000847 /LENGTH=187 /DNA_ID=CAMNT_0014376873 /DNA_START=314 /DNA_END=878 /DNA_ORIENTATION=+